MATLFMFLLGGACVFRTGLAVSPTEHCKNARKVLDILPGRGWDSLENKDMAQVVRPTYDSCKTTDNGEYLIPDQMSTIAVKETDMELTTELFEHYTYYVSATSKSFNAGVAFPFLLGATSVAGAFSPEYSTVKNKQITDKAMTTRVYIRSTFYSILVEPAFELESDLKQRLEKAANDLELGNMTMDVQQAVELIVRDYGTHYQKRIDAGAMLIKEDFVKASFVLQHWADRNQITAAAGVSFLDRISFGFRYRQTVDNEKAEGYNKSVISTTLRSIGGPAVQPNMTENDWLSQIPKNMVVVDRSGDPLYFIITKRTLPNISVETLIKLSELMENVIATYYSFNTHTGCMNMDSPNFDPQANVDDHLCQSPTTNSTFGGLFLNCSSEKEEAGNICSQLQQKNMLTGGFSCPPGFGMVPLNSGTKTVEKTTEKATEVCSGWWIFSKCHTETSTILVRSKATYDSFWCAASKSSSNITGLLFGGLFSSNTPNPVTKSADCPTFFNALSAGSDLKVCVSQDFELGFRYSLPFGGFFSCTHGNPLSGNFTVDNQSRKQVDSYPRYCPSGFSQHMAAVDSGCSINYCLHTGALSLHGDLDFPFVKPPFNKKFQTMMPLGNAQSISSGTTGSIGIGGICVIIAASVLTVLIVLVMVMKLISRSRRPQFNSDYQPIIT